MTRAQGAASKPRSSAGTQATREFYDRVGWQKQAGKTADARLFGTREDGPIRQELADVHAGRVRAMLAEVGDHLNLLECGCGGHPETSILDLCRHYTGTDFSSTGLKLAARRLAAQGVSHSMQQADACDLPFEDGQFDAVYSAHMIYHIEEPEAQRRALSEMMRVLRPDGVLVLIGANPRPLLFPIRLSKRLLADTPVVGAALQRMRAKPPLPYRPMPLGWMKRELQRHGDVELMTYALPSHEFHQRVSEYNVAGRLLWTGVRALDLRYPGASAYLGSYVLIRCKRRS